MNQSTRGDRYYQREDFEEPRKRLPRWLWLAIFLALIASYVAAAVIGALVWEQRTHASARASAMYRPAARLVVAQPAAACTPFDCSKQGFKEYREACYRRAISALIKPKE